VGFAVSNHDLYVTGTFRFGLQGGLLLLLPWFLFLRSRLATSSAPSASLVRSVSVVRCSATSSASPAFSSSFLLLLCGSVVLLPLLALRLSFRSRRCCLATSSASLLPYVLLSSSPSFLGFGAFFSGSWVCGCCCLVLLVCAVLWCCLCVWLLGVVCVCGWLVYTISLRINKLKG